MTTGMYFSILATICAVRVLPKWAVAIMWIVAVVFAANAGWTA